MQQSNSQPSSEHLPTPSSLSGEVLTSIAVWAGRKSAVRARQLSLPSFAVGGVAVLWSWWHVVFRAGSEGGQRSAGAALGSYWISLPLLAVQGPIAVLLPC